MGCVSGKERRQPQAQPPQEVPAQPPIRPLLDLFVSSRFHMLDIFVRVQLETTQRPARYIYRIEYRNASRMEHSWSEVPQSAIIIANEGTPGRLCTLTTTQPLCSYDIRASLVEEPSGRVWYESIVVTKVTNAAMADFKAKFKFLPRVDCEIAAEVDDRLITAPIATAANDYEHVTNLRTNRTGYVPLVVLEKLERPMKYDEHDAFFNITRRKAEVWMMRVNVEPGRFIIRPSHSRQFLALSVRFGINAQGVPLVEHFKIYLMSDQYGCYINQPTRTFVDIKHLVEYYKNNSISEKNRNVRLIAPFAHRQTDPIQVNDLRIPSSQIVLYERLGRGNFGEVYRGKMNNLDVAVKRLFPPKDGTDPMLDSINSSGAFEPEAQRMAGLIHENLVRLICVCIDIDPPYIVTELMNRGSLQSWLQDDASVVEITLRVVVFIMGQIASGMAYLEAHNCIHRDLRAANVLVHDESDQLEVKITDFGLARTFNDAVYHGRRNTLVPIRWTAPEAYTRSEFSPKSDAWSFGILFYEVVTLGSMPYLGKTNAQIFPFVTTGGRITHEDCHKNKRIVKIARQQPDEDICPETLYLEIAKCWKEDPQERPTFSALENIIETYEPESGYAD